MKAPSPGARQRARALRKRSTPAERILWKWLRGRRFEGAKFRRQHPIGEYVVDFCSLEHRLILEIDGGQHALRKSSDSRRTTYLERRGYRVVRFWNTDVFQNLSGVLDTIYAELKRARRDSPGMQAK